MNEAVRVSHELEKDDRLRSQSEICNDLKERKYHDEWAKKGYRDTINILLLFSSLLLHTIVRIGVRIMTLKVL